MTTAIEQPSLLAPCRDPGPAGFEVTLLGVDRAERVSPDDGRRAILSDTGLVTLGAANGELGTVQPGRDIAHRRISDERGGLGR